MKAMKGQKLVYRQWQRVTARSRVQLPPDAWKCAPLVAACRALLLEDRIDARKEYDQCLQAIQQTPVGLALGELRKPQNGAEEKLLRRQINDLLDPYLEAARPLFGDFAEKWLFGGMAGWAMMMCFGLLELVGQDPLDVENDRALRWAWQTYYHKRNKARDEMRAVTKKAGWRGVDDETVMQRARGWVLLNHVYGGSMKAFAEIELPHNEDSSIRSDIRNWQRWAKQINDLLGYKPVAHRPRERGSA